jgi:hypothetical protein
MAARVRPKAPVRQAAPRVSYWTGAKWTTSGVVFRKPAAQE